MGSPYRVVVSESGARTLKVMLCVARGGSVVSKEWVAKSIKGKVWFDPRNWQQPFAVWARASKHARDEKAGHRLLSDYSVFVSERGGAQPSALMLKHLAHAAGAQIVNREWKGERLTKKVDDGLESEEEEAEVEMENGESEGGSESGDDTKDEDYDATEDVEENKNKKKK